MSALSELLNRAFAVKYPKASNRKIADEAGVSRGTIDNYRRGTHPAVPSDEVLTAFHKLLDIPMGELRAAAGLPVGEDLPYVPPREANMLSDRQRRAVDELIRSIVETRRTGHADPPDTADHPPAEAAGAQGAEKQKTKPAGLSGQDQASTLPPALERLDDGDYGLAAHHGEKGAPDSPAPGEEPEPAPDDDDLP